MMDRYVEWLTKERSLLQESIKMLESGNGRMWSQRLGGEMEDITNRVLESDKRKLAELDLLLGGQHGGGIQTQVGEPRRQ
ncbi:hypothetical protein [Rhizobium leucaenae]|uniref:hypothetical protein n=1 Tax=Rhizobium leucaenae TaxID=29450 RepID=UPI0016125D1C|nr:hypothetical protein [Rhizobium leucaenae]MBB6304026.1 hypothetical protein [Rhizobium leucaenae]